MDYIYRHTWAVLLPHLSDSLLLICRQFHCFPTLKNSWPLTTSMSLIKSYPICKVADHYLKPYVIGCFVVNVRLGVNTANLYYNLLLRLPSFLLLIDFGAYYCLIAYLFFFFPFSSLSRQVKFSTLSPLIWFWKNNKQPF